MLGNDGTQFRRLLALVEILLHLFARDPEHAAGHHRHDGGLRRTGVEVRRIIDHKLALERKPRDVFPVVAETVRHVLEATLGDISQPPRRVALALQLVAPAVHDCLPLPLAELPQRHEVNTLIAESLFHSLHDICGTPFLGHFVTFCAVGHHVGHNGITEPTLVFVHQYGLAAVMHEVILQVATEV